MDNLTLKEEVGKIIPRNILKTLAPHISSRKKIDFINEIIKKDKDKLIGILEYYIANKKKELFILEILEKKDIFNIDNLNDFFNKYKRIHLKNDKILDFKFIPSKAIVKIKAHSEKKIKRGEDAETLLFKKWEYRSPFNISCIFHCDDSLIEVKTRSEDKLNLLIEFLEGNFFQKKNSIKKHILSLEDLKKIDQNSKPKKCIVKVKNIPGLLKMDLCGTNMNATLDFLKKRGLNIYDVGDVFLSEHETSKYPLVLYPNGLIRYKKFEGDIYKDIILKILR